MREKDYSERILSFFGVLFFVGFISFLFFYILHDDLNTIDTRVETIDGKTYDCAEAYASDNGMTSIRKPYYIQIPTKTVKVIKRLD